MNDMSKRLLWQYPVHDVFAVCIVKGMVVNIGNLRQNLYEIKTDLEGFMVFARYESNGFISPFKNIFNDMPFASFLDDKEIYEMSMKYVKLQR